MSHRFHTPDARPRWLRLTQAALCCGLVAACGGGDEAPAPVVAGPQVAVTGAVDRPATYSVAQLTALPASVQTVGFSAGGTPQTHTYTGANLWNLLDTAGIQVNAAVKNDVLGKYVVATGADGYRALFSLGELKPDFGNRGNLVAYAETVGASSLPLGADGGIRVTAPGDIKGGRYVSALVKLEVRGSGSTQVGSGGGPSTQFAVSGAVLRPGSYDLAALQALPVVERTVGANVYRGVSLWDFLNTTVGLTLTAATKNDVLGRYVVATGSDGYQTLFTLGEIEPGFGAQPNLIAYELNGGPLGTNGFARVVVPNDIKAGRWVSNLISLEVFAAPPAP